MKSCHFLVMRHKFPVDPVPKLQTVVTVVAMIVDFCVEN